MPRDVEEELEEEQMDVTSEQGEAQQAQVGMAPQALPRRGAAGGGGDEVESPHPSQSRVQVPLNPRPIHMSGGYGHMKLGGPSVKRTQPAAAAAAARPLQQHAAASSRPAPPLSPLVRRPPAPFRAAPPRVVPAAGAAGTPASASPAGAASGLPSPDGRWLLESESDKVRSLGTPRTRAALVTPVYKEMMRMSATRPIRVRTHNTRTQHQSLLCLQPEARLASHLSLFCRCLFFVCLSEWCDC